MTDKAKQFDWPPSYKVGGFGISEMEMKFAVQVADIKDEMILESCKEAARKAGVTDLTVIDRDSLVEYFAGQTNRQRFCPFCHYVRGHEETMTDDNRYKVWLTKITPLPAIDLTTGEMDKKADPPFYALMMDGEDAGEDILPIRFCPMCGRKLEAENEEADK